ncbi:MAG: PfkB family carbohydrate kinase [Phycisphaerales bacterium]
MSTTNHILGQRHTIALAAAADALTSQHSNSVHALVGFDGFVDVILRPVATRHSMRTEDFSPITNIPAFADRIHAAAGKSAGIELVTSESRFGGNGPLLASGLASLGAKTTFIGCIASDSNTTQVHPLFTHFAQRCNQVVPIAQPALTHALEFSDGKIMFNMPDPIQRVSWDTLVHTVGRDTLLKMFDSSSLIGIVNWSIMAGVESILEGLLTDILPALSQSHKKHNRHLFIDLSDPSKRTQQDLSRVLTLLSRINTLIPTTLGLNLNEAELANAALTATATSHHNDSTNIANRSILLARSIRDFLNLATVVVHPREGAAASTSQETLWIDGPFTPSPALSTGAGDHFGAGFAFSQSLNLPLDACLAMAVACSGAYVRDAASPSATRLANFLRAGW